MTTQRELKCCEAEHNGKSLPDGWKVVRLGEVAEINQRRPSGLDRADGRPTTFVPMAAVDAQHGVIAAAETRPYGEVKKGYTYFAEGDVLFAKITPCMQNGKHAIARQLIDGIGFGTTEFHVIRPGIDVVAEWAHFYIRQPQILRDAMAHFTGAVGQQRVPKDFLADLEIPLPSLTEQKRIAGILKEQLAAMERARAAAQAQLEAAKALPAAYLRDVFSPEGMRDWQQNPLGDIANIVSGITLGRKLKNGQPTSAVPYLRVANVKDGHLNLDDVYDIEATQGEIEKLRLFRGDILLTEGGDRDKLGRGTFWQEELPLCIHQNHIFRVRLDTERYLPEFISAEIGSAYGKAYFLAHAKQTTGIATINQTVLRGFPVRAPLIGEQRRITSRLRECLAKASDVESVVQSQLDTVEALPAALLRAAFQGKL